jgi:hypothetical protein
LTFTVFGFVGWFGLRISVFVFLVGGWTQGLAIARQGALQLEPLCQPFVLTFNSKEKHPLMLKRLREIYKCFLFYTKRMC